MAEEYIIAIDQGTTSSRAILYNLRGEPLRTASRKLKVVFPADGYVEQDGQKIWHSVSESITEVASAIDPKLIRAIGVTNQRETILGWDRLTGEPVTPAIVWQCRRSSEICAGLKARGLEHMITKKTGLVLDPYFSGSKILWLLENSPGLRERVNKNEIVFGTMDSWVIYNLTASTQPNFVTEPSNASRTMLYSLLSQTWDRELTELFGLRPESLCKVQDSASVFGQTEILGPTIPITAVLGDQQASLFGHGCVEPNSVKCTFGTGAFLLLNTGKLSTSSDGLITTVAWKNGGPIYALEGSVFMAGALIDWLKDGIGAITNYSETESAALRGVGSEGVVLVPAFVGLGAPYWDDSARGAIFGLTRDSSKKNIVVAALEAVAHQVADLFELKEFKAVKVVAIDGGMSKNDLFCQILADLTGRTVVRNKNAEMTALGVARLATVGAGINADITSSVKNFGAGQDTDAADRFVAQGGHEQRRLRWKEAVARSLRWAGDN